MLRSADGINGYTLAAVNGDLGSVQDLLFDDERWATRYLVADTGEWWPGEMVLISPVAIEKPSWAERRLHVALTKEQVKNSPKAALDKPISRQHEMDYFNYYGWPYYWGGMGLWGFGPSPRDVGNAVAEPHETSADESDTHLRSMNEIRRYHIQATDDEVGHVEDFIVDDETWKIRYMVADTRNWLPGKKVLVSPDWISDVNWVEQKVHVDLSRDAIKGGPEWDPSAPVNRNYEEQLYDYYGRPVYWS